MTEKKKTYLITHEDGTEKKVTIPESWKITFGPAARGMNKSNYSNQKMPLALRIYESETKQRAIFTDVVSFRDMDIEIEVKEVNVQEKHGYYEYEGKRKATTFQAKTTSWVNPDVPREELPMLPSDGELFDVEED